MIVNQKTQEIIATAFARGSQHDFQLFKESQTDLLVHMTMVADSGYQGLGKVHQNSQTPNKRSKRHPLTQEQKSLNRQLSRKRIVVENIIRRLKVFRILSERYRNRRKRFSLRFNLIAAILNAELKLAAC